MLVALDIDGTLMTYDGEISADLRGVVAELRHAGAHLVLATGRSVHATVPVAHELGLTDGWAVSSNGAVTLRLDPGAETGYEVTDRITFDPGPALRLMHAELPDAHFAVEDLDSGFRMNKLFPTGELSGHHEVVDLEDLWSEHVTRLVVRSPDHTSTDFHDLVHRMGLDEVTYAVGWTAWMDIAPKGVTKASALEVVRRRLGVEPARTVAIGDGSNDLQMIDWAARGVAMGHAPQPVREVADEVTGTIDDDGALDVLRSLLR
ncbi:HAD family hydrolase [Pengzhenrongella frigida]|uniref:HAD family hydrolase n=2 Tax=Pengzhenrongella frigida TaxID=1259133 RepID=A0A4Q5N303_9MICO|nr:HAD family hydrolase [Cellulomonas sp. HLT2-17]RYV51633.1 HAD family hydrolase [Cellulomonas sp. HLT2-17]